MKAQRLFSKQASITVTLLFVVHPQTQAYLAPPAIGGYCVHDGLQAECVIPFITHVTHQHFAVFPWVPRPEKGYCRLEQRMISDIVRGFCKDNTEFR